MNTSFNLLKQNKRLISPCCALLLTFLTNSLFAINGLEGTFEFACDAPWRIEPNKKSDKSLE